MDGSNEWPILEPWAVIRIEFSGQLDRKRDDESNFRTPRADPAIRKMKLRGASSVKFIPLRSIIRICVYHCVYRQESGERSALIEIANPGTGY